MRPGFPGKVVPVGPKATLIDPPVLTMVAAFSGFIMALLLPTRTTGDLVAGMWALLSGLGSVPKMLVWDNESGIGHSRVWSRSARRPVRGRCANSFSVSSRSRKWVSAGAARFIGMAVTC